MSVYAFISVEVRHDPGKEIDMAKWTIVFARVNSLRTRHFSDSFEHN